MTIPIPYTDPSYYSDFLTNEYSEKPGCIGLIQTTVELGCDEVLLTADSIEPYYSLEEAVGVQLDTVAKWAGVSRGDFADSLGNLPLDGQFRHFIIAKIAGNIWNGTLEDLCKIFDDLYGIEKVFVFDNQDMTFSLAIPEYDSSSALQFVREIVTKPAGIQLREIDVSDSKIFAFDHTPGDSHFDGWDTGKWADKI